MKFKVGDPVKAMYFDNKYGTTLGPGVVTEVRVRSDGDYRVTVKIPDVGVRNYTVSKSGATDFLLTQAESDRLRALNPNLREEK